MSNSDNKTEDTKKITSMICSKNLHYQGIYGIVVGLYSPDGDFPQDEVFVNCHYWQQNPLPQL